MESNNFPEFIVLFSALMTYAILILWDFFKTPRPSKVVARVKEREEKTKGTVFVKKRNRRKWSPSWNY